MRSRYVAVPPREPLLWGVAALITGAYAAGVALTAGTMHPFELGISMSFLAIAVGNLVFGMPRGSLSVACLFLGDVLTDLHVLSEFGDVGLSIVRWTFVLVGLAFLVASVRSDASQPRFREIADGTAGAD